ncbi:MAG: beta-L-arabinofuranosidase domain-containing protein [Anaerolineaceae bacterium]
MNPATIKKGFWLDRLEVNARQAIFHQWDQLEASGCIENFRIAAGEAEGFREGWFFADSDAYKWLDAAARIWASYPDPRLAALMDTFIALLGRAQMPNGYLFTYNQIHFPGTRWQNLQIEHELYCHGHLIEAGVSHYQAIGRTDLLDIARRAADRIVADFKGQNATYTPGHEEIEIALLRLHQVAESDTCYLEMARQFIEQRGRASHFAWSLLRQNIQVGQRGKLVQQKKREYLAVHPDFKAFQLPPENRSRQPRTITLRWYASALSGKFFQQHAPIREQTVPVGHSVRFAYLETAAAMLARESGDRALIPALEQAWERMVTRRMYVTGGIGSLPVVEGFGNDYELDPEFAYAETCAALGSLFWNWEMDQLTGEAKYGDLFEWQLYNAAAVGMGLDGTTYFYNNPLASRGGLTRQPWYAVPCCPSNLSRTWADLGKYIISAERGMLRVHQYISGEFSNEAIPCSNSHTVTVSIDMQANLPWDGHVRLTMKDIKFSHPDDPNPVELQLRLPAWSNGTFIAVNGEPVDIMLSPGADENEATASGYDPRLAAFYSIRRLWSPGDVVEINFEMPIQLRQAHPRMKGHRGKVALTRGPLVYCLESVDNPGVDIFSARLAPDSLEVVFDKDMLGGIVRITGMTDTGVPLTFIPYFLWGNRGPSQMTVWVNA